MLTRCKNEVVDYRIYLPYSSSSWPAMLICGHLRNMRMTLAIINVHVVMMISLTAPTGLSFNFDMMRPPAKPPTDPDNADDSAIQTQISKYHYISLCHLHHHQFVCCNQC